MAFAACRPLGEWMEQRGLARAAACGGGAALLRPLTLAIGLVAATLPAFAQESGPQTPARAIEAGRSDLQPSLIVAQSSPSQAAPLIRFDIPGQPLPTALLAFGRQAGLQVTVESAATAGRQAPAVVGSFMAEAALRQLLAGTDLTWRFVDAATVTLERAVVEEESGPVRLDPLIVTGERIERTVFDTPSSVAVVTGKEIERTPAFNNVEDILDVIPNVIPAGNSNKGPAIRGIDSTGILEGADGFLGGARPRVTTTVDGRPVSYNEYIFGATSVYDVERVEVFRGPQTTAQGVNSIAGATYVVTADPTFVPEVKAQAEIGTDDRRRVSGAVSGPIVADELAARITFDVQTRDSFVDFRRSGDFDFNPNEFENIVARGKLLWEPARLPELSTKLTVSRTETEGPQGEQVRVPFENLDSRFVDPASYRTTTNNGIHDISYGLSDNLEISNRLSLTDYHIERSAVEGSGTADIDAIDTVNETTVSWGIADLDLNGLFGVYYQHTTSDESIDLSAFLGEGEFDDAQTSLGLFGELTYAVTDRLDVTVGLRYQRDRQDRDGFLGPFTVDFDETFEAFLPKVAIGYDVTEDLRVGVQAVRGFNPGGTTVSFLDGSQDTFDEETVWNFEVFTRAFLLDDRLSLNANAFYSLFSDFQLFTLVGFTPVGIAVTEAANADEAVSYGLELSADFQVTDSLRIVGGLGLLNTEITDFSASADPNLEGNQFSLAPNVNVSLGADYEVIDNLTIGGRLRYVGEYFSGVDNDREFLAGDYTVVDLQVSYAYENFEAYAFVNNAFDEFYVIEQFEGGALGRGGFVGTPREVGVGLRVSF
ncbi:TonB-dependent receptor domain-containing protein [Pelagibius sp.]|uniref:TonB-dependent receptor domain-containing protein n=1 Tax=Pelagibius sp. TaxID=1931238 RepID=UPI003BAFCCA7